MRGDSDITQQIQGLLDQQLGQWPELFESVVFDGAVARAKESYPLGLLPHTEPQFIDHHLEAVDRLFSEINQIDAVETEELIKQETKATIRCIPLDVKMEDGVCLFSGKPSDRRVLLSLIHI